MEGEEQWRKHGDCDFIRPHQVGEEPLPLSGPGYEVFEPSLRFLWIEGQMIALACALDGDHGKERVSRRQFRIGSINARPGDPG
jgi:hypothetical protein